jgi:hypothetical protein
MNSHLWWVNDKTILLGYDVTSVENVVDRYSPAGVIY